MLKKSLTIALFCLFMFAFLLLVANAELIDGLTNFRDKPNGRIIFSLKDKTAIQCEEVENNWSFSGIYVYVKTDSFVKLSTDENNYASEQIRKNVTLYDKNKKIIGKTLNVVDIWRDCEKMDDDFYKCLIVGYTYYKNIRWESSVERAFESVINSCNNNVISYSYLEPHLKKYVYWDGYAKENGFRAFEHPENNFHDMSPEGRIILIFYKDNLVTILYKRKMSFKKYKVTRSTEKFNIIDLRRDLGQNYEKYLEFVATYSGE